MKLTRELNHVHKRAKGASTLAQVCKPSSWEAEREGLLGVRGRSALQSELQARPGCKQRLFLKPNKQTSRRKAAILQEHKQFDTALPRAHLLLCRRSSSKHTVGLKRPQEHRWVANDQEHRKKPGTLWTDAELQVESS